MDALGRVIAVDEVGQAGANVGIGLGGYPEGVYNAVVNGGDGAHRRGSFRKHRPPRGSCGHMGRRSGTSGRL